MAAAATVRPPTKGARRRDAHRQALAQEQEELQERRPNGNAPGGRQRLEEWQKESLAVDRERREAEKRVQAKRKEEKRRWDAEVAKYGQEVAEERRRREQQVEADEDTLPTSELDHLEYEEQAADPELDISLALRVNEKLESTIQRPQQKLSEFEIWGLEEELNKTIDNKPEWAFDWEITHINAVVRAHHTRATRSNQTVSDLSDMEWEKVVSLIRKEVNRWGTGLMSVKFEIKAKFDKKAAKDAAKASERSDVVRPHGTISSNPINTDGPDTPSRRDRTQDLRADDRRRLQERRLAGANEFERQLLHRWRCDDSTCRNGEDGFCFVDFGGSHYDMTAHQQKSWAKALEVGETNVSIEAPPRRLYQWWIDTGAVSSISRRPKVYQERLEAKNERTETSSMMKDFQGFFKMQMEANMMQMADMNERMQSRHKLQQLYQQPYDNPYMPPLPLLLPPPPPPAPPAPPAREQPGAKGLSLPVEPRLPVNPHLSGRNDHQATDNLSSNFKEEDLEDEAIQCFFQQKFEKTSVLQQRNRLKNAYDIIRVNMWKIEDLIEMSVDGSSIQEQGKVAGLPLGLMRHLKRDLRVFKKDWRDHERAAALVLRFGGGFEAEDEG